MSCLPMRYGLDYLSASPSSRVCGAAGSITACRIPLEPRCHTWEPPRHNPPHPSLLPVVSGKCVPPPPCQALSTLRTRACATTPCGPSSAGAPLRAAPPWQRWPRLARGPTHRVLRTARAVIGHGPGRRIPAHSALGLAACYRPPALGSWGRGPTSPVNPFQIRSFN
jgi:hypothetical protein